MNKFRYIIKSFTHYYKSNLLLALGVAISAAVLTGGLIIGDSVTYSLEQSANYRLGNTTHAISAGDRYFRKMLAVEMSDSEMFVAPLFLTEAVAISDGGEFRANKVQVLGIDSSFNKISNNEIYSELGRNEIIISSNLAEKLQVNEGESILLRIKKASIIPLNAPFVSDEESSISFRGTIKFIAEKEELGRFSLKNSQTAPYNVFISIDRLNDLMELENKANHLLIVSENKTIEELNQILQNTWNPVDASLIFRENKTTNEVEIISERVFMENTVYEPFGSLESSKSILTYFVNSIKKPGKETPYSFVSTLSEQELSDNEIVINQWVADDISARVGDTLSLDYFVTGPLRQLQVRTSTFVVKQIVDMDGKYADQSLMPYLPGLADAGHCREWEAGIPIDLDKIRDKDEAYWDDWKGTPKAFISIVKAQEIWANRYGNYTSVRFDSDKFDQNDFEQVFQNNIKPSDIGLQIQPVKEQGLYAAQNGVDFSQLFIGLSFFILIAAIVLSSLLFLLNLENRYAQIQTLSTIGFRAKQVISIYFIEGLFISMVGSALGILLSIFYTKSVFIALNSLWFDIVRTNVLAIKINVFTLILGFFSNIVIAGLVIYFVIRKKLKFRISNNPEKKRINKKINIFRLKILISLFLFIISILIVISQFILQESQNPVYFYFSGGMLLVSFLIFSHSFLQKNQKNTSLQLTGFLLSKKNMARNINRSFVIITLFALGTFVVITTGANKKDMFSGSGEKSSGTGGFLYFAQTTMPVLSDLNSQEYRSQEGLPDIFQAVQFRKIDGDDASCLNLNRTSNPAILGVNPDELKGHFSFAASSPELNKENPWQSLNQKLDGGAIPAIADQTVIQWGLGKKIGDTLQYLNETGDTLNLKLIGGLAASIFQGYIIIGNQQFIENYPSTSGSSIFLIDGQEENASEISDELGLAFRDYGWENEATGQRLAEFYSITNTYLSIFLALGTLGLLLGTIGLSVVLAKSILERKSEIALMLVVGFTKRKIFQVLSAEYFILLLAGSLTGLIAAVIATLPSLISANTDISFSTILWIFLIILINGIFWIFMLSWFSLKNKNVIPSLRQE